MSSFIWFLLGGGITLVVCFGLWQLYRKHQRERLVVLTSYLEAASCGKESALTRTEDDFSMLEDEIYKTVSELRIAREQAQQERKQQADNLADIAHQLKTPLTSMSLMTQLLSDMASMQQQEYIERIDNQLIRLNWLTSSLLTMSRLDAKAVKLVPVTLKFEELAARALESLERNLQERGQILHIKGTDIPIFCDPYWTAEALVNLIKNCSEHTPLGGQITLRADLTPLNMEIIVEDSGPGFAVEDIPYLFRRFFRGKNSAKNSIGIGLALCRAIVEEQGGVIHAENGDDGGARFIIHFYP